MERTTGVVTNVAKLAILNGIVPCYVMGKDRGRVCPNPRVVPTVADQATRKRIVGISIPTRSRPT